MKPEIIKMGSLYRDGVGPLLPGHRCVNLEFSLGDTSYVRELEWVKAGCLLVGTRCACMNVSWTHLDKLGFIFGAPVTIDGKRYLCRSLHIGESEDGHDEWAALLETYGKNDSIWHWKKQFFWGQDLPQGDDQAIRFARGYGPALSGTYFAANMCDDLIGFRPVLESLEPQLGLTPTAIGKHVDVCCGIVGFKGRLKQFDDYDVVVSVEDKLPAKIDWAAQRGQEVTVSRLADIAIWEV